MKDNSLLRETSVKKEIPIMNLLLTLLDRLTNITIDGKGVTLLGICPVTSNVIKASIQTAKFMDFPLMFVATLNQIDIDGGYTGLNQRDFVKLVEKEVERQEYNGPVIIALDHGGPWLKDKHVIEGYSFEEAMNSTMKSIDACVKAEYDLLHIDTTVDITLEKGKKLSIDEIIKRTITLIEYAEEVRKRYDVPRISYEVGTEEVHGGMTSPKLFEEFIAKLRKNLKDKGLDEIWPCFIVGDVGTYPIPGNKLDTDKSSLLVNIARTNNLHLKGHYTDFVVNPEDYPKTGIAAANIGPELAYSEYLTLNSLANIEEKLYLRGKLSALSEVMAELNMSIIKSDRWKKWAPEGEEFDWERFPHDRKQWLLGTSSRYVLSSTEIIDKVSKLSKNLENHGINVYERLSKSIRDVLLRYIDAFNLKDTSFKLMSALIDISF